MAEAPQHRVAALGARERSAYAADADLVGHPQSGHPLDRSKLVRRFKQALDRAAVPKITFHEPRHTFGTQMAAAGMPPRTIQHSMGNADSKTTQIHAHLPAKRARGRTRRAGVRV